jgi:hypothetical protein
MCLVRNLLRHATRLPYILPAHTMHLHAFDVRSPACTLLSKVPCQCKLTPPPHPYFALHRSVVFAAKQGWCRGGLHCQSPKRT